MGPLTVGDSVYLNEVVRTGADSTAKLVFLDSTNLGVGPVSRVTLDRFVYAGESNGQMAVNLARGVFRFTTGKLDKSAYIISTPRRILSAPPLQTLSRKPASAFPRSC